MSYRSGYVAIIGKPNVGKSTFLNHILRFKISIVSPRPQTTRRRVVGIHSEDDFQVIFMDTPGMLDPKYELQKKMMQYVSSSLDDADVILWIVDVTDKQSLTDASMKLVRSIKKPLILALNKIDIVDKNLILPLIDKLNQDLSPELIFPVSALLGEGVNELIQEIKVRLPVGSPFYPPDQVSEHPERFFVAELIREQAFYHFREEIPYSLDVSVDEFVERKKKKDYIRATIFVERQSQKGIIIGKGGDTLKQMGAKARKEIESFLGREVYLELFVKVLDKWRSNESKLRRLGY